MPNQNLILDSTVYNDDLVTIDELNKNASISPGIPRSQLLLTTLTTTFMMATENVLPAEYYQLTRAYLETIKNEDGTSLPNISSLLKFIDIFEERHNIKDEMQKTVIGVEENIDLDNLNVIPLFNSTAQTQDDEQGAQDQNPNQQPPENQEANEAAGEEANQNPPEGFRKE